MYASKDMSQIENAFLVQSSIRQSASPSERGTFRASLDDLFIDAPARLITRFFTMSRRIYVFHRIIRGVAVPVQALGVARVRHEGVGLDEAGEGGGWRMGEEAKARRGFLASAALASGSLKLGRCGERLGLRIGIGEIVAEGWAGRNRPVHGPPFRSPEASAPGGTGEREATDGRAAKGRAGEGARGRSGLCRSDLWRSGPLALWLSDLHGPPFRSPEASAPGGRR